MDNDCHLLTLCMWRYLALCGTFGVVLQQKTPSDSQRLHIGVAVSWQLYGLQAAVPVGCNGDSGIHWAVSRPTVFDGLNMKQYFIFCHSTLKNKTKNKTYPALAWSSWSHIDFILFSLFLRPVCKDNTTAPVQPLGRKLHRKRRIWKKTGAVIHLWKQKLHPKVSDFQEAIFCFDWQWYCLLYMHHLYKCATLARSWGWRA